ncbi:Alpha-ketoglutarate-dependent dioxygenase alkB 6 [Chytriomyces hyalinus]|nr:Alpha-ketoglutarate-dependent dioxygenase alkB 6 [Chytriomyces hyalinus]
MLQGAASYCYIPNFITSAEETRLLNKVYQAPQSKWVNLSNRRLQNWGATTPKEGSTTAIAHPLPDWLNTTAVSISNAVIECAADANNNTTKDISRVFSETTPNNCLINEYLPGQGIMPHTDGPAFKSAVATVTLGSHCVLDFYHKDKGAGRDVDPDFSLLLQPRSLVIIHDDLYNNYLHGIKEVTQDMVQKSSVLNWADTGMDTDELLGDCGAAVLLRETRVSLTFRVAAKLSKLNLFGKRRE